METMGHLQHQTSFKVKTVTLQHRSKSTIQNLKKDNGRWRLVTTGSFAGARCPINDDKAEAHYHKQEAYSGKTGGLEEKRSD